MKKLTQPFRFAYDGINITCFARGYIFNDTSDKAYISAESKGLIEDEKPKTAKVKSTKPAKPKRSTKVKTNKSTK